MDNKRSAPNPRTVLIENEALFLRGMLVLFQIRQDQCPPEVGAPWTPSEPLSRGQRNAYVAMNAKQSIGTINPRDRSLMSAIAPITFGKIAPPMMAITRKEDALLARCPRPKMPSAKMVGNMMDIKK